MDEIPKAPWALTPEALAKVQLPVPEPPEPAREDEPREPVVDLRRTTARDIAIAAALAVVAVLSVLFTYRGVGYSWDEAYYRVPAQMTCDWLGEFSISPSQAVSYYAIDRYWRGERNIGIIELPSVIKWGMGLSWMMTRAWWDDLRALRLPAALAFGASVFLIYLLTLNSYRRRAAVIAALAFMTMPCVFGHAHIAATETITNAVLLLAIYCFFRGLNSVGWAILFGIAYGIALDTKINALLLAPVLLVWGHAFHRRSYVNNFFTMVFVAPLVWIALWPWLWHDTFSRLLEYLHYFTAHQFTKVWYLDAQFGDPLDKWMSLPKAPWHYPIVLTLVTVPLPVLIFSLFGLARTAVHCRWEYRGILFTAYAAVVLIYACLPGSPKFDSTRLFFSLFPMLAILTGGGADSLVGIFPFDRKIRGSLSVRHVVAAVFLAVIAGNGLWGIVRTHPHELSYFNVVTGGLKGARDRFETSYWGESLNEEVIAYLNTLPHGARIRPMAMHDLVLVHLQQWGYLREDLRFDTVGQFRDYDYFLLHVRKGMFGPVEKYLFDRLAEKVFSFRDVPFFCLYSRKEAGELANR
jgi:hypothetical protein